MKTFKRIYHGWVVKVDNGKDFNPTFKAEWEENGKRLTALHDNFNPVSVIEFWDKKVGSPVKLEPTPLGAYRVYTEGGAR